MERSDDPRHGGKQSFRWLPEIDRILIVGMKHGRQGISEATSKVLALRTGLTRADCWKRLRVLRGNANGNGTYPPPSNWPQEVKELLREGYRQGGNKKREAIKAVRNLYPGLPSNTPSRFARRQGWLANSTQVRIRRPWTGYEDRKLWELAGYETAARIAERLGRSEEAVRIRLKSLGLSVRVKDGWSFRALQEMLHVGPSKLRRFIADGSLRVRDPRITATSLTTLLRRPAEPTNDPQQDVLDARFEKGQKDSKSYSWGSAAKLLRVDIEQIRRWITTGELKIVDGFVTERAFQDFCKKCGSGLNCALLGDGVQDWLVEGYSMRAPNQNATQISGNEKHALITRHCPGCKRPIRGNVFFRHIKNCRPTISVPSIVAHRASTRSRTASWPDPIE